MQPDKRKKMTLKPREKWNTEVREGHFDIQPVN